MEKFKVYEYSNCSTCKKALQFLDRLKIPYDKIPIVDRPPSQAELKKMLGYLGGDLKRLFNTSGQLYRELGVADQLKSMTESDALALLSQHGKLVKRPFLIAAGRGAVGFKEDEWRRLLGK